ncbi:MAG: hypothetical protein QM768_09810 [Agriterribacter sp.]
MKSIAFIALLFLSSVIHGQSLNPEDYGYRHFRMVYLGDTVDILIKSKNGEELKQKPLFLFCQRSLPILLIIPHVDSSGKVISYNPFVFNTDILTGDFHLAIISKPFIPLVADIKSLNNNATFSDSTGNFPKEYIERNLLNYYVKRNIAVLKYLRNQLWVSKNMLVISGHSEGNSIAAKLAAGYPKITHVIYSGGNPMGRIMTLIQRSRQAETDTSKLAENDFVYWREVVSSPNDMSSVGDTNKGMYEFSEPPFQYLMKLKIPVLISYGTKDAGAPYNDYLQVACIRRQKINFVFKAYIGTEHNYFPILPDGKIDYNTFNWDKVAQDWRVWLTGR